MRRYWLLGLLVIGIIQTVILSVYLSHDSTAEATSASVVDFYIESDSPSERTMLQTCGVIDSPDLIGYPLDRTEFRLINPYGRVSGRFNGQLHAGDDWVKRGGESLGEPVYAIAPGRVSYSDPLGWGRDKGVVIVEHFMADGTYFYSLYGHMEESTAISFPNRGSCVAKGDILGVIGDPRPAPHLHFEIRNFGAGAPGPGYWTVDPTLRGWMNPRRFIDNWQIWLDPRHEWHRTIGTEAGVDPEPLMRDDGAVIYINGNLLEALDANGGLIWQYRLADSVAAVGMVAQGDESLLIGNRDGRILYWSLTGGLVDQWETGLETIVQGPFVVGNIVLVRDGEGTLYIFNGERELIDSLPETAEIVAHAATDELLAIMMDDEQFFLLDTAGNVIEQREVLSNSDVITGYGQGIFLRDRGTISYLSPSSDEQIIVDELEASRTNSQMIYDATHGQLILWGIGSAYRLTGMSLEGNVLWETEVRVTDRFGLSTIHLLQANRCTLALVGQGGYVMTFAPQTGALSGQMKVWGHSMTNVWAASSVHDDVLRVQIAGEMTAFDLSALSNQGCTNQLYSQE